MDETTPPGTGPRTTGTATPPPGAATPPPGADWERVRDVPRLHRPSDRMVAGVCAGLGRHLAIDPLVLRVAFGVLVFFGGAGLLLYAALWLLLPDEGQDRAPLHLDERSRGFALVGVTVLATLALVGDSWGLYWFPWPLALVALVAWVLYDRSRQEPAPTPPVPPPGAYEPAMTYREDAGWTPAPGATPPAATPAYAPVPHAPVPRPHDPRRRGPVLFWATLALVALAMGVLGTVDLAGADVVTSAYPALALAICAAMLLLGAFWGRAGGIVALALVALVATGGAMVAEQWEDGSRRVTVSPVTAAEVRDSYELDRGDLRVDLSEVADVESLDGRRVDVDLGAGRLVVVVPRDLGVDLEAAVGGPGSIRLPDGVQRGGIAVTADTSFGPSGAPRVTVSAELGVGEIQVVRQ